MENNDSISSWIASIKNDSPFMLAWDHMVAYKSSV